MRLSATGLRFAYGHRPVLRGVDIEARAGGEITALIGPNAAGKSTLLRCLAGLVRGEGQVLVDGVVLASMPAAQRARLVRYLPQGVPATPGLTVFEAVLVADRLGGSGWHPGPDALRRVTTLLERLRLGELAGCHLDELSGGQRQLVGVAQALAGDPGVLLLDEPTSNLDLQHQLELLALVRELAVERRMAVIVAIHDLNLAGRFAERIVVLCDGIVHASGPPASVLTEAMLASVYGVRAVVHDGTDGVPVVTPLAPLRRDTRGPLRPVVHAWPVPLP